MHILIIDDHPLFREGLAAVLRQWSTHTVLHHAASGEEGVHLATRHPNIDVVLLDLNLPDMRGVGAIKRLHIALPAAPVIVISSSEDPADVRQAMHNGASGYLPKSANAQTIINVLNLVVAGGVYVPDFMLHATDLQTRHEALTQRQVEVLRLLCEGMPNKEISRALGMAEKTTKNHISAIFRTLNVVNRTQAVIAARDAGLVIE